jgi:predicted AAA+ superfamily ATPase
MKQQIIQRNYYLKKIEPFIDKNLIKVIVGQRRVGKSYLLLQLINYVQANNIDSNIIYIDKEKFEFDKIRTYIDLIEYCSSRISETKKNYIFIDEIQDIESFEKALRHFYSLPEIDLYCTGSNAKLLSGELATYLSGRYIETKIYSLTYNEFLEFHKIDNSKESLDKYLRIGGLPFLINLINDEETVFEYLKNIFSTIIYKDIITRYNVRNHSFLENLIKYLALNTGNLISAKKISDFLKSQNIKMSPQIVLEYLSYLQNAFLIFKVKRTDIHGKKVFETNEKYYFEDIGLKNVITGISNFQINQVLENVVYNHLKVMDYDITVGISGEKEIDFICMKAGKKIYIQVTYLLSDKKVIEREFGNLSVIKDNFRKIVVSLDEYAPKDIEGIEHIHLRDFLTNFGNE